MSLPAAAGRPARDGKNKEGKGGVMDNLTLYFYPATFLIPLTEEQARLATAP